MTEQIQKEENDKLKITTQSEVKAVMELHPDFGWFTLQTYSGKEAAAKRSVEDCLKATGRIHNVGMVLMPEKIFSELRKDKFRQVKKKLYPGYVFIYAKRKVDEETGKNTMMMDQDVYTSIIGAVNIHGFVGQEKDKLPKLIMRSDVQNIISNLQESGDVEQTVKFEVGSKIKITAGDFAGLYGEIASTDYEKAKLVVNVHMLGTTTPVEILISDAIANTDQ